MEVQAFPSAVNTDDEKRTHEEKIDLNFSGVFSIRYFTHNM